MILALTLIYGLLAVDGQPFVIEPQPISLCCYEACDAQI